MTDESRGDSIKRRRLALGIPTPTAFATATGRDRETIARAEAGKASQSTYDALEAWLDREEAEAALPPEPPGQSIKLTLHGVYGIEEIVLEGPPDQPEKIAEAFGLLLEQIKQGEGS